MGLQFAPWCLGTLEKKKKRVILLALFHLLLEFCLDLNFP